MPDVPSLLQLEQLLEQAPCGALVVDRAWRVTFINPRMCQLLDRRPEQLTGQLFSIICSTPEEHEWIDRFLTPAEDGREREETLPLPGGRRLPVLASSRFLVLHPPQPGMRLILVMDLLKQKQAEDELRRQYEIIARLSNRVFDQAEQLRDYSRDLEDRVRERTAELFQANLDTIHMLAIACEAKDDDTGAHVLRIQHLTHRLARRLGMSQSESEAIALASVLHDVGKLHVPDEILKKPGPLTPAERAAVERHTIVGERILADKPFFDRARKIARHHHENWDGSGYPDHLEKERIPLEARIVHLADVFDALTTPRVYKKAWPMRDAVNAIRQSRGTLFDPTLVDAFLTLEE